MNAIIDFLEGRVSFDEFWKEWTTKPELQQWLDHVADLKNDLPDEWLEDKNHCGIRRAIHKFYNGSASSFLNSSPFPDPKVPKCLSVSAKYNTLAAVVKLAYPDIKTISIYDEEASFYYGSVSDYYDGEEVIQYIENLLSQFSPSLGKTKRIKAAKAALKNAFHVEGRNYPHWVQESEWPLGKNSPMKFKRQEKHGELVKFYFVDVDTGEEKVVEQLY